MKGLTPAEKRETLASFWVDDSDDAEPALAVVDRSTLERYSTCPAAARFIEAGMVLDSSLAAASGEEVHQAIGRAITSYVDSRGVLSTADVRGELEANVLSSRPDVQPDAIRGLLRSVWGIAEYITKRHPDNILRWDGGDGDRSGQLAVDLPGLCRVTSELDLLHATPAPKVLGEVDWKSGRGAFGIDRIADSFQFQVHAWLVLSTYPEVDCLEVRVWHTRSGFAQYPVSFARKDMPKWTARIRAAVGLWWTHRLTPPTEAPAWPAVEKCRLCPAAAVCPAGVAGAGVAANPVQAVDNLIAMEAAAEQQATNLRAYVEAHGPVQGTGGEWFGVKPASGVRRWGLYSDKTGDLLEANDDASDEQTRRADD